ncbi:hypothetical protein [Halomonas sp. E19]|uniref:hypothetical protein n=1 Tax=Halomonas sp. E19 TaxID=3397247 RepID=UPI004033F49B
MLTLTDAQGRVHRPDAASVQRGDYPLGRSLFVYANLPPGQGLAGPERAFFELVLSPRGQATVTELGFVALPETVVMQQRRRLGLDDP